MSKIIKTYGIILNSVDYGESDKILTVLTTNLGKISIMVKGGRKKLSYLSSIEIGCLSNFVLYKASTMYHLNEVTKVENFYNLRLDYEKMIMAIKLLKFANKYTVFEAEIGYIENSENQKMLQLITAVLFKITDSKIEELKKLEIVYKIKAVEILGFKLNCKSIETEIKKRLKQKEKLTATSKIYIESENIYIDLEIYVIIKYILQNKIENIFDFTTTKDKLEKLETFQTIYLSNHLE